ncbi:MAG TPA: 2OG-Fe(II) oxygenase [Gammaproteobacteria bacterium]|nr:2OG-Fe(II) oxygenase [Gammaproteobacteria bacterium]
MYHDATQRKPLINITEIKENSFIYIKKNALARDICREMIRRFESDKASQYRGRIGQDFKEDPDIKMSTDLAISAHEHWQDITQEMVRSLSLALREFSDALPFFKGRFKDIGYNLQRTSEGEYYNWHIDGGSHDFADRQLVALWYLNDVEGPGGATEFMYQNLSVQPEEGALILFPPFWTHEHRNSQLQKGVKYVATTWISFA